MRYEEFLEKIMHTYSGQGFEEEVKAAKKDFFEMAGVFDERTDDFEMKMVQFMDWYLFSRILSGTGKTPIQMALEDQASVASAEEKEMYENIGNSRHSLFQFLKVKGTDVYVKDLFANEKIVIKQSPVTIGFNKDEVFEARLIPEHGNFIFTHSFCFHPPQATRFIAKEVKSLKKVPQEKRHEARSELMLRLFRMKHKLEQYKHVGIKDIYSNDSKLRL